MSLTTASRQELIAIIKSQQREINELKKRIAQLERKLPPNLPFHLKPSMTPKQKKGRKSRAYGYARTRDYPTHVVKHAYSHCPDCGNRVYQGWLKQKRQIINIPLSPATITEHQTFEHWCDTCKKKVAPRINLSDQVLGNHRVSLKLMSYIATLREQERKPISEIQTHLQHFYHLTLSIGEITEICHTIAHIGLPLYEELGDRIRASPVVHADETGWRENGINGYIWNFNTREIKYLKYRKTRGKTVVEEVIGDEFEGVLVSDFYASYNTHLGFHQRCWVHLLRDMKKLIEEYPNSHVLTRWAQQVLLLYQEAKTYTGPNVIRYSDVASQQKRRWQDQQTFRDRLLSICQPYMYQAVPMQTLCQRIDAYQDELFLFIADPRVPSDNNSAERSLRHSVIARKISGGTRSEKGSTTKFILASLFGTWRLQQKNPFHECLNLLTAVSTHQPLPAIIPRV